MAGIECNDDQVALMKDLVESGFEEGKTAVIMAACQNLVFTTAQAVAVMESLTWDSDKEAAWPLFEGHVSDPEEADLIRDICGDEAADTWAGWAAVTAGELADYPVEDDGVRDDQVVADFIEAINNESFSENKVMAAQVEANLRPNPPFSPAQLKEVIEAIAFSDDRVAVMEIFCGPQMVYPVTCDELVDIIGDGGFSEDRLKSVAALKPFIKDAQNKLKIVASFPFSDDKAACEEILRDCIVRLEPPEPPEEAIQEALKLIGSCSSGFAWCKVSTGWRCAAGGHYVSDEDLAAAM